MEQQKIVDMKLNYKDIVIVEDFDEAEQFRYDENDQPVEVGTAVGYELWFNDTKQYVLTCFEGIHYKDE